MWIRAVGVCGVPEPLARESTRLQRTSAHGSVKHADEFFGGVEVQEADVQPQV